MESLASTSSIPGNAATVAMNLRRIMARDDLTFDQVVEATQFDERTLRSLVRGATNAHARTLHKLAEGLGVSIDELFLPPGRLSARRFDRATNSFVENFVAEHPQVFRNWSEADYDEFYSRFGTGGQLTEEGILVAAQATNAKRHLWRQISIILEAGETELLTQFVELLYVRAMGTIASARASSIQHPASSR